MNKRIGIRLMSKMSYPVLNSDHITNRKKSRVKGTANKPDFMAVQKFDILKSVPNNKPNQKRSP